MKVSALIAVLFVFCWSSSAMAQDLLPAGVGLYQLSYRGYPTQTDTYDSGGDLVPLGYKFNKSFDGPGLLAGNGGADLKRLASELQKYDGQTSGSGSLLQTLSLGRMEGDVTADVKTEIATLAYGFSKHWTGFLAVPWVQAQVNSSLHFTGDNNAQAVKAKLGPLAFKQLSDGLDQASQISADQINQDIQSKGYKSVDQWNYNGPGDARVGAKTGFKTPLSRGMAAGTYITMIGTAPTGYTHDADTLTDFNIGKGCYSLGLGVDEKLMYRNVAYLGTSLNYAYSLPGHAVRRVPEADEALVSPDRKADVSYRSGDDTDTALILGGMKGWLGGGYRLGVKRHYSDQYSGSLAGNYSALSEHTDTYEVYQSGTVMLSSVDAFKRHDIAVPFVLSLTAFQALQAKNSPNERYYELGIASFFGADDRDEHAAKAHKHSGHMAH